MRGKVLSIFVFVVSIICFAGCVSTSRTGFASQKLNVVNVLGYSDNPINIEISKAIWNGDIKIFDLDETSPYFGSMDINKPDAISIYVDHSIKDVEYSIEIATVISYFAYIIKKPKTDSLEEKALEHAKNTYKEIKKNVKAKNPQVVFSDPRLFGVKFENKEVELRIDKTFIFSKLK